MSEPRGADGRFESDDVELEVLVPGWLRRLIDWIARRRGQKPAQIVHDALEDFDPADVEKGEQE